MKQDILKYIYATLTCGVVLTNSLASPSNDNSVSWKNGQPITLDSNKGVSVLLTNETRRTSADSIRVFEVKDGDKPLFSVEAGDTNLVKLLPDYTFDESLDGVYFGDKPLSDMFYDLNGEKLKALAKKHATAEVSWTLASRYFYDIAHLGKTVELSNALTTDAPDTTFRTICYSPYLDKWIAASSENGGNDRLDDIVWESSNGRNWFPVLNNNMPNIRGKTGAPYIYFRRIVWDFYKKEFIAIRANDGIYTSKDGVKWEKCKIKGLPVCSHSRDGLEPKCACHAKPDMYNIAVGADGTSMIVGNGISVVRNKDEKEWTVMSGLTNNVRGITSGKIYIDYEKETEPYTPSKDTMFIRSIKDRDISPTFHSRFVATTDDNCGILYSDDNGVTWKQTKQTKGSFRSITYHKGIYVAGCFTMMNREDENRLLGIYTSVDGINWEQTFNFGDDWYEGCYANGMFLIPSAASNIMLMSVNGYDWVQLTNKNNVYKVLQIASGQGKILLACRGYPAGIREVRSFTKLVSPYIYDKIEIDEMIRKITSSVKTLSEESVSTNVVVLATQQKVSITVTPKSSFVISPERKSKNDDRILTFSVDEITTNEKIPVIFEKGLGNITFEGFDKSMGNTYDPMTGGYAEVWQLNKKKFINFINFN